MCLHKQIKVRLKALTELTNDWYAGSIELSWGENILWLVVRVLSPDWPCRKQALHNYCQACGWSLHAWGREVRAIPRFCIMYPGICLTSNKKSRKNRSEGMSVSSCMNPNSWKIYLLLFRTAFHTNVLCQYKHI